jgi:diguanylate cyclase
MIRTPASMSGNDLMKTLSEQKHLTILASMLAGAGLCALVSALRPHADLASPDIAALWSWSFAPSERLEHGPGGILIRTVVEPIALFRNFALTLLALAGAAWFGRHVFASLRRRSLSRAELSAEEVDEAGGKLAEELHGLLDLAQTHSKHNEAYSAALGAGQSKLAASRSNDQIRAAIQFLVGANRQMLRASEDYEARLRESRDQIESLRTALAESQELTLRDSLTNAYSRRHFDQTLAKLVRKANAKGAPLSLIIADIDHFKKINDTFGHPVGDEVLRKVSELLVSNTKNADSVARYGGEEFAIILPETTAECAGRLAEQIRQRLEAKKWAVKGEATIGAITASFGVAELELDEGADALVQRADANLYKSKAAGRNRVSG